MWGVPGSHLKGPNQYLRLRNNKQSGEIETYMDPINLKEEDKYCKNGAVPLEVEAGSIVLLHGSFLHFSDPNRSD